MRTLARDALRDGLVDEGGDVGGGRERLFAIVNDALDGKIVDVVPTRHAHAAVEGDGDGGRGREDPLDALERHLSRDVRPAVAGVAEAMEENADGLGLATLGRGTTIGLGYEGDEVAMAQCARGENGEDGAAAERSRTTTGVKGAGDDCGSTVADDAGGRSGG